MTLYFYTDMMARLPKKKVKRRPGMHIPHPPALAPARGRHLFLIPNTPPAALRRAPRPAPAAPPPDLRSQAARVIAVTRRAWWP